MTQWIIMFDLSIKISYESCLYTHIKCNSNGGNRRFNKFKEEVDIRVTVSLNRK